MVVPLVVVVERHVLVCDFEVVGQLQDVSADKRRERMPGVGEKGTSNQSESFLLFAHILVQTGIVVALRFESQDGEDGYGGIEGRGAVDDSNRQCVSLAVVPESERRLKGALVHDLAG